MTLFLPGASIPDASDHSDRPRSSAPARVHDRAGRRPRIAWAIRLARLPYLLLLEARPPIVAIFSMRLIVAAELLRTFSVRGWLLLAGWVCLTMGAYVYNGITDVVGDRSNGSRRPLASGQLGVGAATASAALLAAVGLTICWLLGPVEGAAGTASLVLGWAYSAGPALKRWWPACALTVGAAAALTYTAGSRVVGDSGGTWLALMLWSLWIGLLSATKDLSDIDGDIVDGRRTLPVAWGLRASARSLAVVSVITAAGVFAAVDRLAPRMLPAAWVLIGGSLLVALRLSRVRPGQPRSTLRRPYRGFMITQFAVNAALLACLS